MKTTHVDNIILKKLHNALWNSVLCVLRMHFHGTWIFKRLLDSSHLSIDLHLQKICSLHKRKKCFMNQKQSKIEQSAHSKFSLTNNSKNLVKKGKNKYSLVNSISSPSRSVIFSKFQKYLILWEKTFVRITCEILCSENLFSATCSSVLRQNASKSAIFSKI